MLIHKVILSSDDHPNYIHFWPIVYKAWKKIGIEPILVYIGNNIHLLDYQDNIIKFNSQYALKTAYVAQCIRLLIPAIFKDDIVIIADIDNIPLKKTYFLDNIKDYDDNVFIHYRRGAAGDQQIAIPWNVAKGSTWAEIFNLHITDNITDILQQIDQRLIDWYPSNYMSINEGLSQSWFTDQILLKTYIDRWLEAPNRYIELNDMHTGFYRLDRGTNDAYHSTMFDINQISRYTDFSPPRPYLKHKKIIDQILHYYSI